MARVKYVGPFDEVEVPALGVTVKRGAAIEAGRLADSLAKQSDWQKVAKPRKPRKPRTAPASATKEGD